VTVDAGPHRCRFAFFLDVVPAISDKTQAWLFPIDRHPRPHQAQVKGFALDGNQALVCRACNTDKGSLSLGRFLNRLRRAGDPRADHVAVFLRDIGGENPQQGKIREA
jgi:hypothetical protein